VQVGRLKTYSLPSLRFATVYYTAKPDVKRAERTNFERNLSANVVASYQLRESNSSTTKFAKHQSQFVWNNFQVKTNTELQVYSNHKLFNDKTKIINTNLFECNLTDLVHILLQVPEISYEGLVRRNKFNACLQCKWLLTVLRKSLYSSDTLSCSEVLEKITRSFLTRPDFKGSRFL
jgi:hypothetical protein